MTTPRKLGIWMDHASAHLIEFTLNPIETKTIESEFTQLEKQSSLSKSEHVMHNKEQHQHAEYYRKLGDVIKNYSNVVLFGPTNAKAELLNVLKADHNFENIAIEVEKTDKMTEHQQHAFVRDHFSRH